MFKREEDTEEASFSHLSLPSSTVFQRRHRRWQLSYGPSSPSRRTTSCRGSCSSGGCSRKLGASAAPFAESARSERRRFHPGTRAVTSIYGVIPYIIPLRIPYITHGPNWLFEQKHAVLKRYGLDVISSVRPLPSPPALPA